MIIDIGQLSLNPPIWVSIITSIALAFALTAMVIPSIIKVSAAKKLFDKPEKRKSHTSEVPMLGGAAVFLGMLVPTMLFVSPVFEHELKYIFVGLLILFFIGIKDDILNISASKKLMAEIFAIAIIAILGDIRISSFHGFLGIRDLPYFISILFTIFVFVVVINGFNLIDGIDGLASGVGILTAASMGIWFLLIGNDPYTGFCFSVVGALLAFFVFNVFGKKNKIFLGDTGSLVIGLIVSVFAIKFLEITISGTVVSPEFPAPAITIAILIVPLIDTLRVFTLRVLVGKSPFKPDRFHLHHKLLLLGFSHLKSTLIILAFNLGIILLSISMRGLGNIKMLLILLPVSILITSIPGFFFRYRVRKFVNQIEPLGNKSWILPITLTNLLISYSRKLRYGRSRSSGPGEDQDKDMDHDLILKDAYLNFMNGNGNIKKYPDTDTKSDTFREAGS